MTRLKKSIYVDATRVKIFLKHTRQITDTLVKNSRPRNQRNLQSLSDQAGKVFIPKIPSISILKDFISSKLRLFEGIELTKH